MASAYSEFEAKLFEQFSNGLNDFTKESILYCLNESEDEGIAFHKLKADPGRIGLETVLREIIKLKYVNDCDLPFEKLKFLHPKIVHRLYQRISSESTWEVKRHPTHIAITLLSIFLAERRKQMIDSLVELLILIVGRLSKRAEKKVVNAFVKDIKKVHGKNTLLMRIAEVALEFPEDADKNVVYPIANKQKLSDIVNEYKSSGKGYQKEVHKIIRSSYSNHYRRIVPRIFWNKK